MKKACFLDRDGVLIEEKHYLSRPEDVQLIPGTVEAIRELKERGFLCIVITNQAGVARGYFEEEMIPKVNSRINELLEEAGAPKIDAWYYCPHHQAGSVPELAVECDCRKPEPGMILRAVKDFNIDLSESCMIGDKLSDIKAAENAGCKLAVLVKTGHGLSQIAANDISDLLIADDIKSALKFF